VKPGDVKGYCRAMFERAGMDSFEFWWEHTDPGLSGQQPRRVAESHPQWVVARAEWITENQDEDLWDRMVK
jgi:hypothetical protein